MTSDQLARAKADAQAFSERARRLLAEAERLCAETPDSDLDEFMRIAKARGMTWVEGLELAVSSMKCS